MRLIKLIQWQLSALEEILPKAVLLASWQSEFLEIVHCDKQVTFHIEVVTTSSTRARSGDAILRIVSILAFAVPQHSK